MATSKQASFLNVEEAKAVAPSVFRSGRQDDILPPEDPAPRAASVERDEQGAESVDAFWNAWFTPVTPDGNSARAEHVKLGGASWRCADSDFSDLQETPERPEPPEITVEVSEYEYETDSCVATPVSQRMEIASPGTAQTPDTEQTRRVEEDDELQMEELRIEEATRKAEEDARRAEETLLLLEQEAARAEEEAKKAKAAAIRAKAGEILSEKREIPSRRNSSWTRAEPKKSILKNRHSIAPVLAMGAAAAPVSDEDHENAHEDPLQMLDGYDSGSSPASRRTSNVSPASRRSSVASPGSRQTSIASTSHKVSCSKSRRVSINVGNQAGGGQLIPMVDYDTSPSTRSRRNSMNADSDTQPTPETPKTKRRLSEEPDGEPEVPPATLDRMRRTSDIAPPPRVTERGTMIRESMESGFEVLLDPKSAKPGLVNCAIQCCGEEIDAEISIMFAKYKFTSQDGCDIPPVQKDCVPQEEKHSEDMEATRKRISFDQMEDVEKDPVVEMSPKTPGLGKPMAIENKVESEPRVRFTDQPFSVQTPGQTITYATTKSIIASASAEAKDSEAPDSDKENRLVVSGGELLIVELPEKETAVVKDGNERTPQKPIENAHEPSQATAGIERDAEISPVIETEPEKNANAQSPGPCSIQKSVELDIPQSTGRKTPVKKRKTPVQLASVGRRSSRRLSERSRSVAQALDFTDEATAVGNSSSKRKSTKSRKSKSPAKMPQPFFMEEDSIFQAGVMQFEIPQARKKGKRSTRSEFVYKGKSIQGDIALFEIVPQETEIDQDWGEDDDDMDVEPLEPMEDVQAPEVIEISPGPSTRSRSARRESLVRSDEERSVRVTRSRSKSEKSQESSIRSELRKGRKSRSSRKVSMKDLPGRKTRNSSLKTAAPEVIVLDSSVKSSSKKRSGKGDDKTLSDAPVADLADDGYDGNFDADDFVDDLQLADHRDLEDHGDLDGGDGPQATMHEETEAEEVLPVPQVQSRRVTRSSLRSAASSSRSGPSTRSGRSSRAGPSVPTAPTPPAASDVPAARPARKSRARATRGRGTTNIPRELRNLSVKDVHVFEDDDEEHHVRRSKRQRFPTLQYWKNEKIVYERRKSQVMPTIAQVVVALPAEDDDSESSTASWLARGPIPRRTADAEAQETRQTRQTKQTKQTRQTKQTKKQAPERRTGRKRTRST